MPGYTLTVLGLELSFAADISPERLQSTVDFLQERYRELEGRAGHLSKERLLTYLALSLADDYLHDQEKLRKLEKTMEQLVLKIDIPEKNDFPLEGK